MDYKVEPVDDGELYYNNERTAIWEKIADHYVLTTYDHPGGAYAGHKAYRSYRSKDAKAAAIGWVQNGVEPKSMPETKPRMGEGMSVL